MIILKSIALKTAMLQALIDQLDAGSTPGTIDFYTGPIPSVSEQAVSTQTLLGTVTLSQPCATIDSNGDMILELVSDDPVADAAGQMAWARFKNGDGDTVFDATVGVTGSDNLITVPDINVIAGGIIRVSNGTITV